MTNLPSLRAQLDTLRPLPEGALKSLRESIVLEWTYHSNAIEGNTLTLKETKVVLEGITVGGKSMHEHLEAINHAEAIGFLQEVVDREEPLTERLIRELHSLVLRGVDDRHAGAWRRENIVIAGAKHRPPDFLQVPDLMKAMMDEYERGAAEDGDIQLATWLHSEFVRTHPFVDGNGRTGRLLMNLVLMSKGWPPVIIRKEDRLRYYEALDKHHTSEEMGDFLQLVEERVEETLKMYLEVLRK